MPNDKDDHPFGADQPDKLNADAMPFSGRTTPAEARVIAQFFASEREKNWPASSLHKRMQSSGG